MKSFQLTLLIASLFVSGAVWLEVPVRAAEKPGGLIVSPAFQEITLGTQDGGQDFFVSVNNATEAVVILHLSVLDFGSLDASGGVAFLGASNDLEKKYALASWMHPEKDTLTLAPGETGSVRVTIENQDTLSPGGHYGALTFKTGGDMAGADAANSIAVNQLFSTLIFVKKVGGEIHRLDLDEQGYRSGLLRFQETLRLRFQNSGNVHLVPRGTAIITDPLHRIVAKGIINQESALILPETFRMYPVHLDTLAMSFLPGRYMMTISYRYDGKDDFTTLFSQFYFIPLPTVMIGLVLAAASGWYVVSRRRNMLIRQR